MATQGPFTWFDWSLKKTWDGTVQLGAHAFHAVLLGSAQSISRSFVGASGDCRYADLTAELATANGYTNGGVLMTTVSLVRVGANVVKWVSDPLAWTLTGVGITFKYVAFVDWTATNKDLVGFADMDTGGGTVSAGVGAMAINPDASQGYLYGIQP